MKTIFNILDKRSFSLIWWLSIILVLIIAAVDIAAGIYIVSGPFLVLPVLLASWYGSKRSGILSAVFATAVWVITRKVINSNNINPEILIYDGISYLTAYSMLAIITTNFRSVHRAEVVAADTDNLTSVLNLRGFYTEFANELLRSIRYKHIFSLAYLDIDNFKKINDSLGHSSGDKLLVDVAECLKITLRATDSVARLGGDEFACLLPETGTEAARKAFSKLKVSLLKRMESHKWTVTFSIGLVTFEVPPEDIKQAIKIADELMYHVKECQKNNIAHRIWDGKGIRDAHF
jgi:diguanylate cyclase (GGDEF)-like protein